MWCGVSVGTHGLFSCTESACTDLMHQAENRFERWNEDIGILARAVRPWKDSHTLQKTRIHVRDGRFARGHPVLEQT